MQSGTLAPSFTASAASFSYYDNHSTKKVSNLELENFKGSFVVLLFYSGDFEPTVSVELMTFQDALKELQDEVNLLAISTDTIESHKAFAHLAKEEGGLQGQQCILVEDKTGDISKNYHVFDATRHKAFPAYIIIDKDGKVVASMINDKKVGGNPHEVVRIIRAYKLCQDKQAGLTLKGTPSNWNPGMELVTTAVDPVKEEGGAKVATNEENLSGEASNDTIDDACKSPIIQ